MDPQPPTLPGYILLSKLGSGGFGEVWLAEENTTHARLAVKFIPRKAGIAEEELKGIIEVNKGIPDGSDAGLVQVLHAHILEAPAESFGIVMEYLPRGTLHDRLTSRLKDAGGIKQGLPPAAALRYCADALKALGYLHRAGLLHRDLKPSNIFVVDEEACRVKLGDYGLVKGPLQERVNLRTPGYAAPEQGTDKEGPATDIYAMGATLFELIFNRDPRDLHEWLYRDTRESPKPLPPAIRAIIEQATATDPTRRYQRADEMRAAIHAALRAQSGTRLFQRIFIATVLVGSLGGLAAILLGRDPSALAVRIEAQGTRELRGLRADGSLAWRRTVPKDIVLSTTNDANTLVLCAFGDANIGEAAILIDLKSGKDIWPSPYIPRVEQGPFTEGQAEFRIHLAALADADGDGRDDIILTLDKAEHGATTKLLILDQDRREKGTLWHWGRIYHLWTIKHAGQPALLCHALANFVRRSPADRRSAEALFLIPTSAFINGTKYDLSMPDTNQRAQFTWYTIIPPASIPGTDGGRFGNAMDIHSPTGRIRIGMTDGRAYTLSRETGDQLDATINDDILATHRAFLEQQPDRGIPRLIKLADPEAGDSPRYTVSREAKADVQDQHANWYRYTLKPQ
jgi:hypothetical protein